MGNMTLFYVILHKKGHITHWVTGDPNPTKFVKIQDFIMPCLYFTSFHSVTYVVYMYYYQLDEFNYILHIRGHITHWVTGDPNLLSAVILDLYVIFFQIFGTCTYT